MTKLVNIRAHCVGNIPVQHPWKCPEFFQWFDRILKSGYPGKDNIIVLLPHAWETFPSVPNKILLLDIRKEIDPDIYKKILSKRTNFSIVYSEEEIIQKYFETCYYIFFMGGSYSERYNADYFIFYKAVNPTLDMQTFLWKTDKILLTGPRPPPTGEDSYLNLLRNLMTTQPTPCRNGFVRKAHGIHLDFNLSRFPLLTTKFLPSRIIIEELLFFLRGDTDTTKLEERGVNIWKANTNRQFLNMMNLPYEEGEMGPMYGYQWRNYGAPYGKKGVKTENEKKKEEEEKEEKEESDVEGEEGMGEKKGIDQLDILIKNIIKDPYSRRNLMTTLNLAQVDQGVLWPCHGISVQFCIENNKMICVMTQRSADAFLGLPFNIASYAALTHIVCKLVQNAGGPTYIPGRLTITMGDVHIYQEHEPMVLEQISKVPFPFPVMKLETDTKYVEEIKFEDFVLSEYACYPRIKAPMIA